MLHDLMQRLLSTEDDSDLRGTRVITAVKVFTYIASNLITLNKFRFKTLTQLHIRNCHHNAEPSHHTHLHHPHTCGIPSELCAACLDLLEYQEFGASIHG